MWEDTDQNNSQKGYLSHRKTRKKDLSKLPFFHLTLTFHINLDQRTNLLKQLTENYPFVWLESKKIFEVTSGWASKSSFLNKNFYVNSGANVKSGCFTTTDEEAMYPLKFCENYKDELRSNF